MTRALSPRARAVLLAGLAFLLLVSGLELFMVLRFNHGTLVYTLDDPYIHMALAEHIRHGHYGVNAGEFSSPSSSILWPFLIVPFASLEYGPLVFNLLAALATVFVYARILEGSLPAAFEGAGRLIGALFLILLILATNVIGLVFTGMEHSLQLLAVAVVAWGLILEGEHGVVHPWLVAALIVAPLVRYENLAVSVAAAVYLAVRGHARVAALSTLAIAAWIGGFSLFLMRLGLDPLPESVVAKSSVVGSGHVLDSVLRNVWATVHDRQGALLLLGTLGALAFWFFGRDRKVRAVLATAIAVPLHAVAGQSGWYHRYEIYIWGFCVLLWLHAAAPALAGLLGRDAPRRDRLGAVAMVTCAAAIAGAPYIVGLFTLPYAANNIYDQQYQMHRFAVGYYGKPVAVNDLGYVSYKNDAYVLDLWGLGSRDALRARTRGAGGTWMARLAAEHHVEMAMLYEAWFQPLPPDWIKVGDLTLSGKLVTPASATVAFYATHRSAYAGILKQARAFARTLPEGARFTFVEDRPGGVTAAAGGGTGARTTTGAAAPDGAGPRVAGSQPSPEVTP